MNPDSKPTEARWQRIKTISRLSRWTVIGFLVFAVWLLLGLLFSSITTWSRTGATPGTTVFDWGYFCSSLAALIYHLVLCCWYWKLAQLFRLYERGSIFTSETIRCIKTLGLLCLMGWALMSATHFLSSGLPRFTPPALPQDALVTVTTQVYRLGFFSFDFGTGIDFGVLLGGLIVVLAAWIMDEGRKLQEEQALTV